MATKPDMSAYVAAAALTQAGGQLRNTQEQCSWVLRVVPER